MSGVPHCASLSATASWLTDEESCLPQWRPSIIALWSASVRPVPTWACHGLLHRSTFPHRGRMLAEADRGNLGQTGFPLTTKYAGTAHLFCNFCFWIFWDSKNYNKVQNKYIITIPFPPSGLQCVIFLVMLNTSQTIITHWNSHQSTIKQSKNNFTVEQSTGN